ncbi:nicotinamide-nucleotide adenylyltransferase [Methanoregula sp.]|uniref:nicotinamide-nucleotide adenylyltransferase n=1 Tax=Methanoregula sp. TaxID=2052170 RepID=UPI002375DC1B|nr:nicotinamide-nucleotide adenylyltransferase [Methanoregula sp.]MDD1687174.1 nicotinamide-nucleotide adenylyltransferase [Methanoregula sp.]
MKRGFYVGRFQPFHNGHQTVLEHIAGKVDEIIIGIGSAQLSHHVDNPFTAGERVLMITRSLATLDCPYYVIPIEDVQRNALWVAHVRSMAPPFDVCYSSNPLVVRLFHEAGVNVQSPAMYERELLCGTEIRRRIIQGEPWKKLVPPAVVQVLKEIDGEKRLRQISRND